MDALWYPVRGEMRITYPEESEVQKGHYAHCSCHGGWAAYGLLCSYSSQSTSSLPCKEWILDELFSTQANIFLISPDNQSLPLQKELTNFFLISPDNQSLPLKR